jgi:hypothetical protein
MPELTHNNYFIWGYNGIPFRFREKPEDKYFRIYRKPSRRPMNFRDECLETAKLIYEKNSSEKLMLFLSGGLDSHVIAECFRILKIPFTAVTVILGDNWNYHDIKYADAWCEANSVKQIRLKCDIQELWDSGEYWDLCKNIQAETPQYCGNIWGLDQIDGFPILGLGEPDLQKTNNVTYDVDSERFRIYDRYLMDRKRKGVASFFKYTPELKACVFSDFHVHVWVYWYKSKHLRDIKNKWYIHHFDKLEPRPLVEGRYGTLSDYSGYEFVPDSAMPAQDKARVVLESNFKTYTDIIKIEFWEQARYFLDGFIKVDQIKRILDSVYES